MNRIVVLLVVKGRPEVFHFHALAGLTSATNGDRRDRHRDASFLVEPFKSLKSRHLSRGRRSWPSGLNARTLASMRQHCEVCEAIRPEAGPVPEEKLVYVEFPKRTVRLCTGHALIAKNSGVHSFEQLRELYGSGRRSHVPRRGDDEARRSKEKRKSAGRRLSDARG
jgi:hypothetical protein